MHTSMKYLFYSLEKKKPYADYDPCPRPMAWARVTRTIRKGKLSLRTRRVERGLGKEEFFPSLLSSIPSPRADYAERKKKSLRMCHPQSPLIFGY